MEELKTLAFVAIFLQAAPLWLVRQPALAVSHLAPIWAEWAASQGDPSSPITTCSSPSPPVLHHHHLFLTITTCSSPSSPPGCKPSRPAAQICKLLSNTRRRCPGHLKMILTHILNATSSSDSPGGSADPASQTAACGGQQPK